MEVANVIFSAWEAMSGREESGTVWLITNSSARIIEGMNSREDIIETYLIKDFLKGGFELKRIARQKTASFSDEFLGNIG